MGRIDEMAKGIQSMSGKYSTSQIFADWVELMALSIANGCRLFHDKIYEKREEMYTSIKAKYSDQEFEMFCKLLALLTEKLEEKPSDVLGTVFMQGGLGNKHTGQFFTPFHLSGLCAKLSLDDRLKDLDEREKLWINEPSCGGGGMIIAVAAELKERGYNYQKIMRVIAQDLDWRSVYMCYVQLSLLGIDAIVVQGDTLQEPFVLGKYPPDRRLITPKKAGALL